MLDWGRIDNYYTFQRLVNNLFALECNSPGFIPGNPYIGADGGWDGQYSGSFEGEKGLWSIQSKWTSKSFQNAVSYLKPKVREGLRKAKENGVDHLRIATNAKLRIEQVRELESLNEGEASTLKIWHRENLEQRIEQQIYLRSRFFGAPQYTKLVPWDAYFRRYENHLLQVSATAVPNFRDCLKKATRFISSPTSRILLVISPDGNGKSHFLREIARMSHTIDFDRQAWIVIPRIRRMRDALQDEIVNGRNYLLIYDDADRFIDEFEPLVYFCKTHDSVKVILSATPSGFHPIYSIIARTRCEEIYETIVIAEWQKKDLINLLRIATGKDRVKNEEAVVSIYSLPYLVAWIGRQIARQPNLAFGKVKERFVNGLEFEAKQCLRDRLSSSKAEALLVNLACLVPFPVDSPTVLGFFAEQLNRELGEVRDVMSALEESNILKRVGNSLRFDPDIKGDIYLSYRLEGTTAEKIEDLIMTLLPVGANELFTNLSRAGRYSRLPTLKEVLTKVLDRWATNPKVMNPRTVLNLMSKIGFLNPEDCLMTFLAYLDVCKGLTTDNYGPVLSGLVRVESVREDWIRAVEELAIKGIEGTYSNYKPPALIEISVSPLYNSVGLILRTLDVFQEWLENINPCRIKLISFALAEILRGSHSYSSGLTFGEKILKNTSEIREMREKALEISLEMLRKASLDTKLAAIAIAEEIGRTTSVPEGELPLSGRIADERERIVDRIAEAISPEEDFRLLGSIETLFLKWWAMRLPGTNRAVDQLRKFPRPLEYVIFRYYVSPDFVVEDFNSLEEAAPAEERWHWYVFNRMHKSIYLKSSDFGILVESLDVRYSTQSQIIQFLKELDEKISHYRYRAHPPILTCWVESNPQPFLSIHRHRELWKLVPSFFAREIELAIGSFDQNLVRRLGDAILSELPKPSLPKLETFLSLLRKDDVEQRTIYTWLSELLEKGDTETKAPILLHLSSLMDKIGDPNAAIRLLLLVISEGKMVTPEILQLLSLVVRKLEAHVDSLESGLLQDFRRELLHRLIEAPKLDYSSVQLLDFACDNIDSLLTFIEERLCSEARKGGGYTAIPYEGIDIIANYVGAFEDFEKIIGEVTIWLDKYAGFRVLYSGALMKPVILLRDAEGGLLVEEYIRKQFEGEKVERAIAVASCIPLDEETTHILRDVAARAVASGKIEEARSLLHRHIYPQGAWTPSDLGVRRTHFQRIYEESELGVLKATAKACLREIDDRIEESRRLEEEILDSRT